MKHHKTFSFCIFHFTLFILFSSCITMQPVEVRSVNNFKVNEALTKPKIQFDIGIHNPNNFGLTVKEFKSTVFTGDQLFSEIVIEKKIRLGAKSDISIPLEMQPSLKDISFLIFSGNVSKDIKVEGYVTVQKFIFRKKFPFTVRTKL